MSAVCTGIYSVTVTVDCLCCPNPGAVMERDAVTIDKVNK